MEMHYLFGVPAWLGIIATVSCAAGLYSRNGYCPADHLFLFAGGGMFLAQSVINSNPAFCAVWITMLAVEWIAYRKHRKDPPARKRRLTDAGSKVKAILSGMAERLRDVPPVRAPLPQGA